MGETIELQAADGHRFSAYRTGPADAKAGLVVIQEIFGVNSHIRDVADRFGAQGYAVIAPALFDRVQRGVELGYDKVQEGVAIRSKVPDAGALQDITATVAALGCAKTGIIGYCWGGTMSWVSASQTNLFAVAVGWYGGGILTMKDATLNCPVQLHFGETDHGIPLDGVEAVRQAHPEIELYIYEGAGHGFGCDQRGSYNEAAYQKAQARSLGFLQSHLG